MAQFFVYALTSTNINRFLKLFHCRNQEKFVISLSLKIPLYLKCFATIPCEMSNVLNYVIYFGPPCIMYVLLRSADSRISADYDSDSG